MSDVCRLAHTNIDPSYPGYINVTETDSSVRITVRGDPITREDSLFVCGHTARDVGRPGRCTPGDEHCNNYCNCDPSQPMPDSPKRTVQVFEGHTVQLTVTRKAWELMRVQLR